MGICFNFGQNYSGRYLSFKIIILGNNVTIVIDFWGEKINEQETEHQTFLCAPCVAAMWHLFIGLFWIRLLHEYELTSCLFGEYVECHMLTKGWWHLSDRGSPAEGSFLIQLFCLCVCVIVFRVNVVTSRTFFLISTKLIAMWRMDRRNRRAQRRALN